MNSKLQLLRNSTDKNCAIYYTMCRMIRSYNSCKNHWTCTQRGKCASQIGTDSSYEVWLNSKQQLLIISLNKNCAILHHVQHDQGLQQKCWRYAHLQMVLNLPMKFYCIPSSGCWEIARTKIMLYYNMCSMIRGYNLCKNPWTGTCWWYAHLLLVPNLPIQFRWIPSKGCW